MEPLNGNPFADHLSANRLVLLDGGLATALEADGHELNDDLWSARILRDVPEAVVRVHRSYRAAGADCLTTASYQASAEGFAGFDAGREEADDLLKRATRLAREAIAQDPSAAGPAPLVAASVGPYAAFLADGSEYTGQYEAGRQELEAFHAPRWATLTQSGPDLMGCETIPNRTEAEVLLGLLAASPSVWAWFSFCCGDGGHLWDGTPIEVVASACDATDRVAAVGVNCTAPRLVPELVARIRAVTDLPIIAYPNSGERYDVSSRSWSGTDDAWMEAIDAAIGAGARIVGGCCRIGPARIAELRARIDRGDWDTL